MRKLLDSARARMLAAARLPDLLALRRAAAEGMLLKGHPLLPKSVRRAFIY